MTLMSPVMTRWRRLSPRRRMLLLAALAAVLLVAGWMLLQRRHDPGVAQRTAVVAQGSIEDTVTAQGTLQAKSYVDVGTQVSGQLLRVHAEVGSDVPKGMLLAEIDPTVYQTRVDADRARIQALQAQLAQQRAQVELARQIQTRNETLVAGDALSRQELETGAATLKSARAAAGALQAQIAEQTSTLNGDLANLGFTKIYAPISATVVSQTTRVGQTVNANQQAPIILQLANLDTMTVQAQVAEADVGSIKAGMDVYFTTLGNPDKRWHGQVRQVLPSPEIVNDVVLYLVLIDVDNHDRALMSGMTAQVFFVKNAVENVLTVPMSALALRETAKDASGTAAYVVRVLRGGEAVSQTVQVGLMNRTQAEVRSGLRAGDRVVTGLATNDGGDRNGTGGGGGQRGAGRRGPSLPFM